MLELLVVIVIIGLLAGLVAPKYIDTVGKSKSKVARAQIDSLEKALDQYRLEVGTFPTQKQGLTAGPNRYLCDQELRRAALLLHQSQEL